MFFKIYLQSDVPEGGAAVAVALCGANPRGDAGYFKSCFTKRTGPINPAGCRGEFFR
jgi:hypothetical protein